VRSEKLVAEAGVGSGTQRYGNGRRCEPLQININEDREDFMCAVGTVIFGVCNSVRLS
jgi:hypothetical protein